jgi:hypothetical protein
MVLETHKEKDLNEDIENLGVLRELARRPAPGPDVVRDRRA